MKSSTHSTRRSLGTLIAAGGCSWSPYVVALILPNEPWSPPFEQSPYSPASRKNIKEDLRCVCPTVERVLVVGFLASSSSLLQWLFMGFLLGRLGLKRYSLRQYLMLSLQRLRLGLRGLASNSTWAFCIFLTSICGVKFLVFGIKSWLSDSALGQSPQPTCRGQTERDLMVWLGPEAAALCCPVGMKVSAAMVLKVARALTGGHLVFSPQHHMLRDNPTRTCLV